MWAFFSSIKSVTNTTEFRFIYLFSGSYIGGGGLAFCIGGHISFSKKGCLYLGGLVNLKKYHQREKVKLFKSIQIGFQAKQKNMIVCFRLPAVPKFRSLTLIFYCRFWLFTINSSCRKMFSVSSLFFFCNLYYLKLTLLKPWKQFFL